MYIVSKDIRTGECFQIKAGYLLPTYVSYIIYLLCYLMSLLVFDFVGPQDDSRQYVRIIY